MLFQDEVAERKTYDDSYGKDDITVGVNGTGFTEFVIVHSDRAGEIQYRQELQFRYAAKHEPYSELQVEVSTTKWNYKGRAHTTYSSFALPIDMVQKWIAPLIPQADQPEHVAT